MADVAANLYNWSTTASSNLPADATTIGAGLADNFQQIQATVRGDLASKGADIASATTTDLGAVVGKQHDITGTTTITGFGTVAAGIEKLIQFDGALTLTHNATSLILPGGANITTVAGDVALMVSEGSGNWRCAFYRPASVTGTGKTVLAESPTITGTLKVTNTGSGNSLLIEDSASTDSTPFLVDASGNVVGGHTSAIATFNTNQTPRVQVHGTSIPTSAFGQAAWSASGAVYPTHMLASSRSATKGSYAAVVTGDIIGRITSAGDDGTDFEISSDIVFYATGTISTGIVPGLIKIRTANSAGNLANAIQINSNQDVELTSTRKLYLDGADFAGDSYITHTSADTVDHYAGGIRSLRITDTAVTTVVPVITPAATTSIPSVRIPHGTAPTSPTNGDMWTTTAGLFVQINGVTKTVTLT